MTTTQHDTTTHTPAKPPDHKAAADPTTPPTTTPPTDAPPTPKTIADAAAELITDSDTINAAMEASLRVIGAMTPADQAKMFAATDDDDARQGLRERRSSLIRGRLGLLAEKDAQKAADAAKNPPATDTTTPPDKTPATGGDKPAAPHEKHGFFGGSR